MKRGLVGVQADDAGVLELSASKRLRVQPDDGVAAAASQTSGQGLLDLPDLVLFELCHWFLTKSPLIYIFIYFKQIIYKSIQAGVGRCLGPGGHQLRCACCGGGPP